MILNANSKTTKLLEKNTGENLHDNEVGKDFFDITLKG